MKKNLPVSESDITTPKSSLASKNQELEKTIRETDSKIMKGLEKTTASTGTPISELNGGAKFMAQLSNIGGGSVETGGGGIRDGFNTIASNISAKSKLGSNQSNIKPQTNKLK